MQGIERECQGMPVRQPEHEFLMGEGDDKISAYTWAFIPKFELADANKKDCRKVLGLLIGYLYTMAGMSIESQDRMGRVEREKLLDPIGRVEFTSRIFVTVGGNSTVYSFSKLRLSVRPVLRSIYGTTCA